MGETRVYVRELYNIESQAGEVDFGRGLRLRQLPSELVELIDAHAYRLIGRWKGKRGWFLENEHLADATLRVGGEPSGALRIFRIALILFFGETVKLGPIVHISKCAERAQVDAVSYPRVLPWPNCPPDEFVITPDVVPGLHAVFDQLVKGFKAPLLRIPIERLISAAETRGPSSDAIIDQSIALEALFLQKHDPKGKALRERGAAFLGSVPATQREETYRKLGCFYKARNRIIHEGEERVTVGLRSGYAITSVQLRDWCFKYLRKVIRRLLAEDRYLSMNKKTFVSELRSAAKVHASEFEQLEKRHFGNGERSRRR